MIFTTIQKFVANGEALSERSNIVVIADEAHRSQYDFIDGYASAMREALPNASFIGFTGTPIELKESERRKIDRMSRRICVDVYNAITKLRPEWHSDDDKQGVIKIVMTGSASDPLEWQGHIRNKARREELAKRFQRFEGPVAVQSNG